MNADEDDGFFDQRALGRLSGCRQLVGTRLGQVSRRQQKADSQPTVPSRASTSTSWRTTTTASRPWVLFLSGDEEAKPAVAQLIRDAGFDPVDLGGINDSQLQDPGSALWTYTLTHDEATARISGLMSFGPDQVAVDLDGTRRVVFASGRLPNASAVSGLPGRLV